MAFFVSKFKEYKEKKEKDAWEKKLEHYAQKKFGMESMFTHLLLSAQLKP